MGLDPRFIPASYFQLYFVDKDTFGPLAGGIVTFYSDENRTQLKPVYQISGTPLKYTYTVLPNPIQLNGDGTFSDQPVGGGSGNDIIPYFFPYEGVPDDNNNTVELYYITVTNSLGVPQFIREGVPNTTTSGGGGGSGSGLDNFIPNGQFLLHNDGGSQVLDTTSVPGINRLEIAQGGWTFEVNSSSTSTNTVVFQPFSGFLTPLPTESPKVACRVSCTAPTSNNTRKDLCVSFFDVNKFAASVTPPANPQQYTLYFEAQNNGSGTVPVEIVIIKFFGIGGTATTDIIESTITIGSSYSQNQVVFDFGDNTGTNITTGDFVQIAIRFPLNAIFDVSMTNFVLNQGSVNITTFPVTPNNEVIYKSLGYLPTPSSDGSDLYLPLLYGPEGYFFDDSQIGKLFYTIYSTPGVGELEANGQTLIYSNYSSDGIPYSRLGDKVYALSSSIPGNPPPWGTGQQFVTTYQVTSNPTGGLRFDTNQFSTPLPPSAGSSSPALPFTVNNDHLANNYFINSYLSSTTSIGCQQVISGLVDVTKFTAGTSGLSLAVTVNAPLVPSIFFVSGFVNVTSALAGKYFTFQSANGAVNYYVWFKVDGAGSDPAPVGFTGIEVDLYSSYLAVDFACVVREALNGYQITSITTTAGSTVLAGSYFTFSTLMVNYYVWYTVNGVGTQPAISGTPIKVVILSGDTAAQVANKTALAMNKISYALPDYRGKFMRVWDNGANVDPSSGSRLGHISYLSGDLIPTLELDLNQNHLHSITSLAGATGTIPQASIHLPVTTSGSAGSQNPLVYVPNQATGAISDFAGIGGNTTVVPRIDPVAVSSSGNTNYTGSFESRPINEYVNCVIKY